MAKVNIEEIQTTDEARARREAVAKLIQMAKGEDRKAGTYARAAGVSPAALSRMLKAEYMPSPDTMRKLTSEEANPQGGVTYDELMQAAGYTSNNDELIQAAVYSFTNRIGLDEDGSDIDTNIEGEDFLYKSRADLEEYMKKLNAQIYAALIENAVVFKKVLIDPESPRFNDLEIELIDQPIDKWGFEYKYYFNRKAGNVDINITLGDIVWQGIEEGEKISLVINDDRLFQLMKRKEHKLSIRGELSVIYYDEQKDELVEEVYLSNYMEGNQNREIYIAEHE